MADDYVDENGRIRWVETHERLSLQPLRDERDGERDEDGNDEDEQDDDNGIRVAPR